MIAPSDRLSPETIRRVQLLFSPGEQSESLQLLADECGNNLPFLEKLSQVELARYQFAAIKLSNGNLPALRRAIELAKTDWRDLLVAAGFGEDVAAHLKWVPEKS